MPRVQPLIVCAVLCGVRADYIDLSVYDTSCSGTKLAVRKASSVGCESDGGVGSSALKCSNLSSASLQLWPADGNCDGASSLTPYTVSGPPLGSCTIEGGRVTRATCERGAFSFPTFFGQATLNILQYSSATCQSLRAPVSITTLARSGECVPQFGETTRWLRADVRGAEGGVISFAVLSYTDSECASPAVNVIPPTQGGLASLNTCYDTPAGAFVGVLDGTGGYPQASLPTAYTFPPPPPLFVVAPNCVGLVTEADATGADFITCGGSGEGVKDISILIPKISVAVFNPYGNRVLIRQLGLGANGRDFNLPPAELVDGANFVESRNLWVVLVDINCTTPSNNLGNCHVSINDDTAAGVSQYWYWSRVTVIDGKTIIQAVVGAIVGAIVGLLLLCVCCCLCIHAGGCVKVPCCPCIPYGRRQRATGGVKEVYHTSASSSPHPSLVYASGGADAYAPQRAQVQYGGNEHNPVAYTREQRVHMVAAAHV